MDEYLGRQHEEEVLQAFERVQEEFRILTEENEEPVLEPQPEAAAAAIPAAAEPLVGRSKSNASRSKKTAKPQKESKKSETRKSDGGDGTGGKKPKKKRSLK